MKRVHTVMTGLVATLVLALAIGIQAESGFWTGNSSSAWQANANWSGFGYPSSRCKYAAFNGAGNGNTIIDVGAGLTFDAIIFDTTHAAAYTIGSGGVGIQTLTYYGAYRSLIYMENTVANNQVFNANLQGTAGNVMQRNTAKTLTFAGNMWNSGASGAGTFALYGAGNIFISGIVSNNNGSGTATLALAKYGAGTLTLSNTNTYTGATTVSGGTLTLNRQTGSLSAGTALTFGGPGAFNMDNAGASGALSQGLGALTFSAGDGTVRTTRTAAYDQAIVFSSLAPRTAGAGGNFVNGGGVNSTNNGFVLTGVSAGFIDKGVFYGGADYASMDGGGTYVRGLAYGSDANAEVVNTITASKHVKLTSSPGARAGDTLLSLNLAGSGVNYSMSSGTLTVPAILKSGGGDASAISGGSAVAGGTELVIRADTASDSLLISTPITGTALTKSGAGTVTLGAANGYTGTTTVNAGTLAYGVNDAIGSGAVTINGGTLGMGSCTDVVGAVTLTAGAITGSGTLTGSGYTMNNAGDTSVSVVLGGSGGLTKSAPGTLTLSNSANTYTGPTQISGGILVVSSLKNGGVPSGVGASDNSALNLDFKGGTQWSTLRYVGPGDTTDRIIHVDLYGGAILDASGTGPLKFTNTAAASLTGVNYPCWIDFSGTNTDDNTFNLSIPTAGTGVGIIKSGPGRWILTGTNTFAGSTDVFYPYDGAAIIMGGTLGVTWLANGGVGSPLGASANTAAKLCINGGMLQYLGSGAGSGTTDRLFSLGPGPAAGGLDASGAAGSPFVWNNNGSMGFSGSGARTLTLTGTNTDDNTLAAAIGNSGGATSLVKDGPGRWVLTAANTCTGTTTILDGTLALGASASIATTNFTIMPGAVFDVTNKTSYVMAAGNLYTFGIERAVGRIDAGTLDISNARVAVSGRPKSGGAYVIADYTSRIGSAFAVTSSIPTSTRIDYNFNGGTQIALIVASAGTVMVVR